MTPIFPQSIGMTNARSQIPFGNSYNQIPGMSINFPTMLQQNTQPDPILIGVHGLDSVKQYPTKPNQTIALHDLDG